MRTLITTALISLLFLANAQAAQDAREWSAWNVSNESNHMVIDHSPWGDFLLKYVVTDDSGINKVAYGQVTPEDREALARYLSQLTQLDPRVLNKSEQFAYWINLYNALTVDVVLRHPGKGTILRMGHRLLSIGPWRDKLIEVGGEELTLDDIEHRILRPIFKDPRLHYAINCASLGCPNLLAEPYTAANLDSLLSGAERSYINHQRGVAIDGRGQVRLSKIFNSYQEDFAADEAGLLAYLAEHHETLGEQLREYRGLIRYHYDWGLNAAK